MKALTKIGKICLPLLFTGLILQATAQVETLPFNTNFSDNTGWVFVNGDCNNKWHIGKPAGSSTNALFVSPNGTDTVFTYNTPSRVFVKKLFKMDNSERITVEFDIRVGGGLYEGSNYLKVYIMDTLQYISASSQNSYYEYTPYGSSDYNFCGLFNGKYYIENYNGHVSMQIPNPAKGQNAYLVIMWRNESNYSETYAKQPAPIITNLSLKPTPDNEVVLESPKNIYYNVAAADSALFQWAPGRDEIQWEVKMGENGTPRVTSDNIIYYGNLTNHTYYTLYVRAKKDNFYSEWVDYKFYFDTDPIIWTHGPDTVSHEYARLTGAVEYVANLRPLSFGLSYKKLTDNDWILVKGTVTDQWDGHYEIIADANNLSPFTWYAVGGWVVSYKGDTIFTEDEFPHYFTTYDNYQGNPATLPYTATFDNSDYWGLTKGNYNWYTGKLSGHNNNSLFISPNGTDTSYIGTAYMVTSYAQKMIESPNSEYITVKMNLKIDGSTFMNHLMSSLTVALSYDPIGGVGNWFEEKKTFDKNNQGELVFYMKKPQYYRNDSAMPLYLILMWEDMSALEIIDYEKGDFACIINSISVEVTPNDIAESISNCVEPVFEIISVNSFTSAYVYYNPNNYGIESQYKLGNNGQIIDNNNNNYIALEGLTPNTDYEIFIRNKCKDSSWTEWVKDTFSTKALPEVYILPVKEITETSANIEAYLYHDYMSFNKITEFGFEYMPAPTQSIHKRINEDWIKLNYNKIDTIIDYTSSILYKIYAPLDNLQKNKEYIVREYAVTENGITTYSDIRSFKTGTVRVNEIGENISMNVYPNPAEDFAIVQFEGFEGQVQVTVTDMQGKIVYKQSQTGNGNSIRINTSNFAAGLYFIKVQNDKSSMVDRIAIQ